MTDHARMGDPRSSEDAVRAITSNRGLQALVLAAANALSPVLFDDTDLTIWVETETGRRQQRNVIARARGRLEMDGELIRWPVLLERDHGKTVHFRITPATETCFACNGSGIGRSGDVSSSCDVCDGGGGVYVNTCDVYPDPLGTISGPQGEDL